MRHLNSMSHFALWLTVVATGAGVMVASRLLHLVAVAGMAAVKRLPDCLWPTLGRALGYGLVMPAQRLARCLLEGQIQIFEWYASL